MQLDEFLYRGPIAEEKRGGTYHVVLRDEVTGKLRGPMTPAQAEAEGFPLDALIAEINAQAASEVTTLRAEKEAVEVERDAAKAQLAEATKALAEKTQALAFMAAAAEKAKA